MKTNILVGGLICLFLISCTTTGPKHMYTTDLSSGDVTVPVKYVGGLDTLNKKTKGNLFISNSSTKFVSEQGVVHFNFPTSSISGVYVGDEVKRHFGKTLARSLLIGPFAFFFKDKSEVIAIEFTEKEKNIIVNPIFQIKVGTGPILKKNIQAKHRFAVIKVHWETATTANTISAYEAFLKQHSDSEFAGEARSRLDILKRKSSDLIIAQPTKEQLEAFRSAKAVQIMVEQSYGEAEDVNLPFEDVARSLFEYAGLKIVSLDIKEYDLKLTIKATGKAIGELYHLIRRPDSKYLYKGPGAEYLYTGASLNGSISIETQGINAYKKYFKGYKPAPRLGSKSKWTKTPSGAPFKDVFYAFDSFTSKIMEMMGEIYGTNCIIEAIKNKRDGIPANAIYVLNKLKDPHTVEPLVLLLKDKTGWVRRDAARALGNIGDPRAVEPLVDALKKADDNVYIQREIAEALGKIGDPRAIDPLIAALGIKDLEVTAGYALKNITQRNFGEDQEKWQKWWNENKEKYLKKK